MGLNFCIRCILPRGWSRESTRSGSMSNVHVHLNRAAFTPFLCVVTNMLWGHKHGHLIKTKGQNQSQTRKHAAGMFIKPDHPKPNLRPKSPSITVARANAQSVDVNARYGKHDIVNPAACGHSFQHYHHQLCAPILLFGRSIE